MVVIKEYAFGCVAKALFRRERVSFTGGLSELFVKPRN